MMKVFGGRVAPRVRRGRIETTNSKYLCSQVVSIQRDASRPLLDQRFTLDMFCQALTQAYDRQDRWPCQGFGKNAGIANIQSLDLGLQMFIDQRTHANGPTRMGAA